MGFFTSSAIVSASFLLGILFTSLLWDATVLYGLTAPITEQQIEGVESYYLTWWNGGMAVKMVMHVVMVVLFLSLVAKWARHSETAFYFTGASILMLICAAALYIVVTLPSIRVIARDPFNTSALILPGADFFTRMQQWLSDRSSGVLGDRARENAKLLAQLPPMKWQQRVEHVQVLCAANTIAMVLLVGIVILQVSEWYLDEQLALEELDSLRKQVYGSTPAAAPAAAAPAAVTAEKKKQ
ncbi:Shr3 amino acid permease chaperone [Rhodotorula diobovata]|uniref:Shr3 amino acid permease chaperone n=1 Tax=Rhodotorula diobovata TaxID=5288 RepID=A0A5C5G5H2_9BASI|nr:Shr3 amino acid permease chaperone [Rhodotorula diobovata]